MHICVHMYTHICMYVYEYMCAHVHTGVGVWGVMHVYLYMDMCTCACSWKLPDVCLFFLEQLRMVI